MNILKIILSGSQSTIWRCRVIRKLSLARCVCREKYLRLSFLPMILVIVLFSVILLIDTEHSNAQLIEIVKITEGDEWHYFKGMQEPPQDWYRYDFDMSSWQRGPVGIGYGIASNRTYLADMKGNYSTLFARKEFTIDNRQPAKSIKLSVVCDGPFVVYLNGIEMIRTKTIQISDPILSTEMLQIEEYDVSGFIHELIPDINILAIQCDNDDIISEDFTFIPVFEVLQKMGVQE